MDAPDDGDEITIFKIDVEGLEDDVLRPFLEDCPEDRLPDCVLVETVLESRWRSDLRTALVTRGYIATFEAEGNTLSERRNDDVGIA